MAAFEENLGLARENKYCWSRETIKLMKEIEIEIDGENEVVLSKGILNGALGDFSERVFETAMSQAERDHRDFLSSDLFVNGGPGERKRTYLRLFRGIGSPLDVPQPGLQRELMRFRMGNHPLRVVTGAWGPGFQNRAGRLCPCCSMGVVEDEVHFVLECPRYASLRNSPYPGLNFRPLFNDFLRGDTLFLSDPDVIMRNIFGGRCLALLGKFLHHAFLLRSAHLNN